MENITEESIRQAFDKAKKGNDIQDGVFTLIKKEHYASVLHFLQYEFVPSEYIFNATKFKWNPEIEALFVSALQQNISLMLLDKDTGDVMGIRLMGISKAGDKLTEDQFNDPGMKMLIGFWNYGDEQTRLFERFNIKESIHYFGLGVDYKYRKRGLGTLLVDLSLQFVKNLNISPVYVKAEASSLHSMRIFEKAGFELLAVVPYEDYKRDGQIVIPSTDVNTCMKTYVKVV